MRNTINTTIETKKEISETREALRRRIQTRGIEFNRNDAWQRINEHVETHKYLLDLRRKTEVEWIDAALSWEESVMNPLLDAFERQDAAKAFPKRSVGDLFIEISDHWYFLKQDSPSSSADDAVASFTRQSRQGLAGRLSGTTWREIVDSIRDGWNRAGRMQESIRKVQAEVDWSSFE